MGSRIEQDVSDTYILGPARIALGNGASAHGRIAVEQGRIARILPEDGPSDLRTPDGAIVAPGMIDIHTNGADDFLFLRDQGEAVPVASRAYARQGATGYLAGIMTAPWDSMMHAAAEVSEAANELFEADPIGARCLGIHFEGPFLNPKFRRVHRNEWLVPATMERVREMVEACRGALVMVTMAPEAEGVEDATRFFFDQGIVCSAGHTSLKYDDGKHAIGFGFRALTHAFNAMPPLDHRDPSLLAAFIQEDRTFVQLICDGHHVAPPMVDILYRTLHDRLILATDNMPPVGEGYRIDEGVVRSKEGTIAGSALSMDQAVRNLMQYAEIPFETAIVNATMAPARLLGLEREYGSIEPGKRADLSVWTDDHEIIATIVGGHGVFGAAKLSGAAKLFPRTATA